jgi:hypothetical protein
MGQLMPARLLTHLESHGVLTALFASSWFLTLFASEFPLSFVGRLLDVLLSATDDSVLMKVRPLLYMVETKVFETEIHTFH